MNNEATYLNDYKASPVHVSRIILDFDIFEDYVKVNSQLTFSMAAAEEQTEKLILNGVNLKLTGIWIDGRELDESEYQQSDDSLTIFNPPFRGDLTTTVIITPKDNTELEGLYYSDGIFCTQNEPEGFRKITFFPDRPDILSKFTTTVRADKSLYPQLLSNGNPVDSGALPHNRHFVTWEDPFPKPCYLFALVAGDLGVVQDFHMRKNGKPVQLKMYVDKGNEKRAAHAIESLKRVMKWDEETFGLEYQLDVFMIVAVDAFVFGAMENTGLNIFNASYALADPESATDTLFQTIESFVAHEFLHNWSGNRVTCRDWFQLTLKEGMTVFRDNEYTSDLYSREVKRIDVVTSLRKVQFSEDAGPLSHPVKPESYIAINNFYTTTVFQKGKEIIKMLDTMIGRERYRSILASFFRKFDGQAITTDDFLDHVEGESQLDLTQFRYWYSRKGTPECLISGSYDKAGKEYSLVVRQKSDPFHFPLKLGLLDPDGRDISLNVTGEGLKAFDKDKSILHIRKKEETFLFTDVDEEPVPSLLRDFSAPVLIEFDYSDESLIFLMKNDSDLFNRYEAGRQLALRTLKRLACDSRNGMALSVNDSAIEAYAPYIDAANEDLMFSSRMLDLPTIADIADLVEGFDVGNASKARNFYIGAIAGRFEKKLVEAYKELHDNTHYGYQVSIARRSLKNKCLEYLGALDGKYEELVYDQFRKSETMTDVVASLKILADRKTSTRDLAFGHFFNKWKDNKQVLNQWFALQAEGNSDYVYDEVLRLEQDPHFDKNNPNKFRSLFGTFAQNLLNFHHDSGRGYRLIADRIIEADVFNSKISAGLAKSFSSYPKMDDNRKGMMKEEMLRISEIDSISRDVTEVLDKIMA